MLPHLGVHRRCEDHRAPRGQQSCREQVVSATARDPSHQIGSGRCHYHQVRLLAETDMRDLWYVGEDAGADRLSGQRLERGTPDEFEGRRRRNNSNLVPALSEATDE